MLRLGLCVAALASIGGPSPANTVNFDFEDNDRDSVWNVTVAVFGASLGLGAYNIQVVGLDAAGVDNTTVFFEQASLGGLGADFVTRGFDTFLDGPVGDAEYSAAGSQFNVENPIEGIGQVPIFVDMFEPAGEVDVDLGVPALIGTLTAPRPAGVSYATWYVSIFPSLLAPAAQVIGPDGSFVDAEVTVSQPFLPEPSSALLVTIAASGCLRRSRAIESARDARGHRRAG